MNRQKQLKKFLKKHRSFLKSGEIFRLGPAVFVGKWIQRKEIDCKSFGGIHGPVIYTEGFKEHVGVSNESTEKT